MSGRCRPGPARSSATPPTIQGDSWHEIGERIAGDAPPVQIFELNLQPGRRHRAGRPPIRCRCAEPRGQSLVTVPGALLWSARRNSGQTGAARTGRRCMGRDGNGHVDLEGFMAGVERRNPGQSEFIQAVRKSPRTFSTSSPTRRNITAGRSCAASPSPTGSSPSGSAGRTTITRSASSAATASRTTMRSAPIRAASASTPASTARSSSSSPSSRPSRTR